jgi:hypothetical protein
VEVRDAFGFTPYSIEVIVTNNAPKFSSNPTNQNGVIGQTTKYPWPSYSDAEGEEIEIIIDPEGAWYSHDSTYLTLSPTSA